MSYPKVTIKPAKESSILRKHPWIFSGAIKHIERELTDGEVVEVVANKGRHLGYGHFQDGSIAVRLLAFGEETFDENIFFERLQSAFALRQQLGLVDSELTNMYRLVHGEGDGLPGLIIDHYGGNLVVQCHSIGMYKSITLIVTALEKLYGNKLQSILLKSGSTLPKAYTGYEGDKCLVGKAQELSECIENGNRFLVNISGGQKTGFFIDQRENRKLLAEFCKGKKVLNTFSYTGGFSIYALNAGATFVNSVDSSQAALDLTEKNVTAQNKTVGLHKNTAADVMDFIQDFEKDYDVIVLDPPAFAKNQHARHNAVQGYKRLNGHAIRQIKPGGIIFTFSCSQVIDPPLFAHTVISAAMNEGRRVRILQRLQQPADHPISAFHPEGEYLKGLILQVE